MFADLSVKYDASDRTHTELVGTLTRLRACGYTTVAIETTMPVRDALRSQASLIPIAVIRDRFATVHGANHGLTILSRLTCVVDDANLSHQQSAGTAGALRQYDIIAARPTNMAALQFVCSTFEADIIAVDLTVRLHFHLRFPTISAALARGLVFEIPYGPAVRDVAMRRHLVTNSASLARLIRRAGVLLVSNAACTAEVRDPYAVAAIAAVFGLPIDAAKDALSVVPRAVLYRSRTRKSEKAVLEFL